MSAASTILRSRHPGASVSSTSSSSSASSSSSSSSSTSSSSSSSALTMEQLRDRMKVLEAQNAEMAQRLAQGQNKSSVSPPEMRREQPQIPTNKHPKYGTLRQQNLVKKSGVEETGVEETRVELTGWVKYVECCLTWVCPCLYWSSSTPTRKDHVVPIGEDHVVLLIGNRSHDPTPLVFSSYTQVYIQNISMAHDKVSTLFGRIYAMGVTPRNPVFLYMGRDIRHYSYSDRTCKDHGMRSGDTIYVYSGCR